MVEVLMKEGGKKNKEDGAEKVAPRSPQNIQMFATMTGKADAVKLLADRIARRNPEAKESIYVQIDGDPALQSAILDAFESRANCGLLHVFM